MNTKNIVFVKQFVDGWRWVEALSDEEILKNGLPELKYLKECAGALPTLEQCLENAWRCVPNSYGFFYLDRNRKEKRDHLPTAQLPCPALRIDKNTTISVDRLLMELFDLLCLDPDNGTYNHHGFWACQKAQKYLISRGHINEQDCVKCPDE